MRLAEAFAKRPGQQIGQKLSKDALAEQIARYLFQERMEYMQQQWDGKEEGIGDLAPTTRRYDTFESFIKGAGDMSLAADSRFWGTISRKAAPLAEKKWDGYVDSL